MVCKLWVLPVAPTELFTSPEFRVLARRQCELSFSYEGESGENKVSLVFEGVEAFKCTYITSCTPEMIKQAYGELVDLEKTTWLNEVFPYYIKASRNYLKEPQKLHHLMICFDDGPCYEFICTGFRQSPITKS